MKSKLLSGENSDLQPRARESSDYFPSPVKDIAERRWRKDCTVIEPGKHTIPKAAIKDGDETIPAIYQTLTDRECYAVFEDTYKGEIIEAIPLIYNPYTNYLLLCHSQLRLILG